MALAIPVATGDGSEPAIKAAHQAATGNKPLIKQMTRTHRRALVHVRRMVVSSPRERNAAGVHGVTV
ncbi:MAG TPA: hypothetical protein VN647_10970 [Nitrospira sp.]|nr:hypothetical protein [Nitrospira sp.]